MLAQRQRRWANIETALWECPVCAGSAQRETLARRFVNVFELVRNRLDATQCHGNRRWRCKI